MTIPATPTLVDPTATHQESTATVATVLVCQKWSARRPTAVQNVWSTRIVRRTRLVSAASARILVPAYAGWMRSVKCATTSHCASASPAMSGIRLLSAISQHVSMINTYLNFKKKFYLFLFFTFLWFFKTLLTLLLHALKKLFY